VIGFGTGVPRLVVAAVLKMPVRPELGAADGLAQVSGDDFPGGMPMPLHKVCSDLIGNALVAQFGHQPIEQNGAIVLGAHRPYG
jgi:hypothetical protein